MARTDPARELAATLEKLTSHPNPNATLDQVIADQARVDQWSSDFFLVLFELIRRCEFVEAEIAKLPLDDDVKKDALRSVQRMRNYLNQKQIISQSLSQAKNALGGQNITILKMLSSQVRENISYEALEEETREELLKDVHELIGWLRKQQDEESDFIRQSLIEGLESFAFRLERLGWFGSGYAIDSLREVIHAYLALQGATLEVENGSELIDAMLMKTRVVLSKAVATFKVAKSTSDSAGWALQMYGAVSALQDGSQTISGLIGN